MLVVPFLSGENKLGVSTAAAAQLTLRWNDTSDNEDGFKIERKPGATEVFAEIATVGMNVVYYADTNVTEGETYCYRVQAYNTAGDSDYSNEACGVASVNTARIGVFRPSTGRWYLDVNGNGVFDDCALGGCLEPFGQEGDLPVVGDWTGAGIVQIGVFEPATSLWKLDYNNNDRWDGCSIDLCIGPLWRSKKNVPVVGRWRANVTRDWIGVSRPKSRYWRLDLNENGKRESCKIDGCRSFGSRRGFPVVGDWTGTGTSKLGTFESATGQWKLDLNDNGKFDQCAVDRCGGPFGTTGDNPVVGDWNGTGQVKIGVFTPTTGIWTLDFNGNDMFDGCTIDACLGPFGQPGDLPVVGKW
jgi:hypothetical protein